MRNGIAALLLTLTAISQPLLSTPTRVSDFATRAQAWHRVAVAPPDCGAAAVTCSEVAELVEKWTRSAWGPQTVSAASLEQMMMDKGIGSLDTPERRAAALRAANAEALIVVRIVSLNTPPSASSEVPTVSIEARVYVADRETPIATGQESRGAFSAWGAVERTVRILVSDIFAGAHH